MADARNHHFVSQGYLRGFSEGAKRQARVTVFDRFEGKTFPTLTRNIGSKRDYNRLQASENPNSLEHSIADFEAVAIPSIRNSSLEMRLDYSTNTENVFRFMAMIAARHPLIRQELSRFVNDLLKLMTEATLSTQSTFEAAVRNTEEDEASIASIVGQYDMVKSAYEDRTFEMGAHPDYIKKLELGGIDTIARMLSWRDWTFISAPEGEQIITSDRPVALIPTIDRNSGYHGLGYAMPHTAVVFPLTSKVALWGEYGNESQFTMLPSLEQTRYINTVQIANCMRQIYAANGNFTFLSGYNCKSSEELLDDEMFQKTD